MIAIYHNKDLDGFCSGAIIKKKYPDCKLIGYDYNQPFEAATVMFQDVIMADVSMPMEQMLSIAAVANSFIWIDHHASSAKDFDMIAQAVPGNMQFIFDNSISACEGTWRFLFPDEPMPEAVHLLGEYDTWRDQDKERWKNYILPFQYGMRGICFSPETFPMKMLDENTSEVIAELQDAIYAGKIILNYQRTQNERACRSAFETTFEGLRAICLNHGGANSQTFESVYDESKHDAMIAMYYSGYGWTFTMYTTKKDIDLSVIAKRYKGGGHRQACGFKTRILPEEFVMEKYHGSNYSE